MTRTLELTDDEWAALGFAVSYAIVMSATDIRALQARLAWGPIMDRLSERLFKEYPSIMGRPTPDDVEGWLNSVD